MWGRYLWSHVLSKRVGTHALGWVLTPWVGTHPPVGGYSPPDIWTWIPPGYYGIQLTSVWYTSYWNAFLFSILFTINY